MANIQTLDNVAHPFQPVKPPINTQLPLFENTMIHHNRGAPGKRIILRNRYQDRDKGYGVSCKSRALTPGLFTKKYDRIRQALLGPVGLTPGQAEITLRLLRLRAFYGKVYAKESQITETGGDSPEPFFIEELGRYSDNRRRRGLSKATFWRTIRVLRELGLVNVVNRFVIRPHAQISNLYRLDRLVLLIVRYLAEHGARFLEGWLKPYLTMPGRQFWPAFLATRPFPLALSVGGGARLR